MKFTFPIYILDSYLSPTKPTKNLRNVPQESNLNFLTPKAFKVVCPRQIARFPNDGDLHFVSDKGST